MPSIYICSNGCLSVKYLTMWWIAGVLESEPICPAYSGATGRNCWGWQETLQKCKGGSGATGGQLGDPHFTKSQFSIEFCFQFNQQWIWSWASSWGCQATWCTSDSPINRWQCSRPEIFNSQPAPIQVSGTAGLGHRVHSEKGGLGFWYARSTGGGWIGSWQNFHLGGSGNNMQTADWDSCHGVSTVDFVGKNVWRVGQYGTERLYHDWLCRMGVV